MKFDFQRWLPLIIVVAMSGALVYMSMQNAELVDTPVPAPQPMPPEITDYTPPANIRVPFEYDVIVSTLPPKIEEQEVALSTSAKGPHGKKGKAQLNPEERIYINGIIWSPVTPLVSINGRILTEGATIGKDIKILKIMPNKVRLQVKNKIVDKKP